MPWSEQELSGDVRWNQVSGTRSAEGLIEVIDPFMGRSGDESVLISATAQELGEGVFAPRDPLEAWAQDGFDLLRAGGGQVAEGLSWGDGQLAFEGGGVTTRSQDEPTALGISLG